jgi:hypothetical protein
MAQKRIDYYGQFTPTGVDTSQAKRLQALSGLAEQVGDIAFEVGGRIQKRKAIEDASAEALAAVEEGRTPEIKEGLLSSISIYDQSFNETAQKAYTTEITSDIRTNIARIAAEAEGDFNSFRELSTKYFQGISPGENSEYGPEFTRVFNETFERNSIQVEQLGRKNARAKAVNTISSGIEANLNSAEAEAIEGDVSYSEQLILESVNDAQQLVNNGDATQEYLRKTRNRGQKILSTAGLEREIRDSIKDNDYKAAFSTVLSAERPEPQEFLGATEEGFTPSEWETYKSGLSTYVARQKSVYEAATDYNKDALRKEVRQVGTALSLGYEVDPSTLSSVIDRAQGTEYEADLNNAMEASTFSVLPATDRAAILTEAKGLGTLEGVSRYQALATAENGINTALADDPLRFAIQQGIVPNTPLDISSSDAWLERVSSAEAASLHYGLDMPALTKAEATKLSETVESADYEQKLLLSQSLNQNPAAFEMIDKAGEPLFAMIASTNDPEVQEITFKGQQMLADGVAKSPTASKYLPLAEDFLGPVGEVYASDQYANIIDASLAYLAKVSPSADLEVGGASQFKDALAEITGGIGIINDSRFQLPRGISEDQFQEFIDTITPTWVEANGGTNLTIPMALKRIESSTIVSEGNGKYFFAFGDNQRFVNKEGNAFTFEYEPLTEEQLRERAIELREFRRERLIEVSPKTTARVM